MDRQDTEDGDWPPPRHGKGVVMEDGHCPEKGRSRKKAGKDKGKGKDGVMEDGECRPERGKSRRYSGGVKGVEVDGDLGMKMSVGRDPFKVLGQDILSQILSKLDAFSVARSLLVSHGWQGVACRDSLWAPMLHELWKGKAHLPRLAMTPGISKLQAFSISYIDGQRNRIMKEDLCDHIWFFHFAKTAPEYWRDLDPYWNGDGPLMRRYFHDDGSVSADPEDRVWGGHECTYSIVTSHVNNNRIRQHYVRINRWPPLTIVRNEDWSWTMENQLCVYSSIPDPEKPGGTGPLFLWDI